MLAAGGFLPSFSLPDQSGAPRSLENLSGPRGLALFVYSKDNTSGCSSEAKEFQERLAAIKALGFGLAGLSKDSPASHAKFAAKLGLGYPLLADPELVLLKALGAWGEKIMYGKPAQGAMRSTLVCDPQGKLLKVYAKVKAAGHAQQVLEDLASLA